MSSSEPTIFRHQGPADFIGRDAFQGSLESLAEPEVVILDFSETDYMDSSAISQIIWLLRARTKTGRSAPRIVQGRGVARIFELAGIGTLLPIFDSLADAQRAAN